MTSERAPPTIPVVQTGTPPMEWTEFILSSPEKDTPAASSETKGTAGNAEKTEGTLWENFRVPGGLESLEAQPSEESKPTTTTKEQPSTGPTVMQTAKQYMPEQVGKAVDYATQTAAAAASYLPDTRGIKETVSSYLPAGERREEPHFSLPSTELRGAQPAEHVSGVGSLPGNLSESSVALLPDERQERAQEPRPVTPRQRRNTIKPSTEGGDDEPRESEKEEAKTRETALSQDEPAASQSSDLAPKSVEERAVGSTESDTAATSVPEVDTQTETAETKNEQVPSEQGEAGVAPVAGMVGTAPEAQQVGEKGEEVEGPIISSENHPQDKGLLPDSQEEGNKGGTQTAKKVEPGYGEGYHPAQLHPPPPGASVAEYKSSHGAQEEGEEVKGSPTKTAVSAEKKPGFMTMVKGEMKILAGKMSGDEHQVEEGKKIVHGDA